MNYKQTTQVPNEVFDVFLPTLTGSEYKLLSIIIRQTYGWRKERDRMNYTQLIQKTGLSRRVIADSIQSLVYKKIIRITDYHNNMLDTPAKRKGKTSMYFSALVITRHADTNPKVGSIEQKGMQEPIHNKTNSTKEIVQGTSFRQGRKRISDMERIEEILRMRKD